MSKNKKSKKRSSKRRKKWVSKDTQEKSSVPEVEQVQAKELPFVEVVGEVEEMENDEDTADIVDRLQRLTTFDLDKPYNPFGDDAPDGFRNCMNAIHGFPFGGSAAFIGYNQTDDCETVLLSAGEGVAAITREVKENLVVEARSGGFLDGDFAEILINGVDYSPNKKGMNLVVINPDTLDAYLGVFDTHSHIGNESILLARFLESIPNGHIIVLAVRYDAARRLHPEARKALRFSGLDLPVIDDADVLKLSIDGLDIVRAGDLLPMAAAVNSVKCVELLLEAGWDVNHCKRHGSKNAAIHDAVFHGSMAVVDVLLAAGADTSIRNKWNETAEDIAEKLFGFSSLDDMIANQTV